MYGAIPYVMETFALDRDAACRVVCDWVDRQQEHDDGPGTVPPAGSVLSHCPRWRTPSPAAFSSLAKPHNDLARRHELRTLAGRRFPVPK